MKDAAKYNPKKAIAARRNDNALKVAAMKDATRIASFLIEQYGARVHGIGSLFDDDKDFSRRSDIDLVVEGLPKNQFFAICAEAQLMTDLSIDIIPYEDANDLVRETVKTRGVAL